MNSLLATDFIAYLKGKVSGVVSVNIQDIRMEIITDPKFDIKDKETTIKQPVGKGSVTYYNSKNKRIIVIDYENFLDFQLEAVIKKLGLKKPDFIVYDMYGKSYFIVNELSQGDPDNKRTTAFKQMHSAIFHFDKILKIKSFVNEFRVKRCVFSNRKTPITTPERIADAFVNIDKRLPEPIKHNYQPITKMGYDLIETASVTI